MKQHNKNQHQKVHSNIQFLFQFIRNGLGYEIEEEAFGVDWKAVIQQAAQHGLSAIVIDGLARLPKSQQPKEELLLICVGRTVAQEKNYARSWMVAQKLANVWQKIDVEAVVLKGQSFAQYYPRPEHRYSCDLDVFIAGTDWERACKLLEQKGVKLEFEVYKEVEFTLDKVYVECHRVITPVRGNKHLQRVERYLRKLLDEKKEYFEGTSLIRPSLMFNAILFVEHALGDFLHGKLVLKHLVDWMVLRKQPIDWAEFDSRCQEFGFDRFVDLINALVEVIDNKKNLLSLPQIYQDEFNKILNPEAKTAKNTWFERRVDVFFEILKNRNRYHNFGYCSMLEFLLSSLFSHFLNKKIKF